MVATQESISARVRARLNHPVIDADGHVVECGPVFREYIQKIGGARLAERYAASAIPSLQLGQRFARFGRPPLAERQDRWIPLRGWGGSPIDVRDRATAMVPRLLNERLDEFGIDFMIVYPSEGLSVVSIADDELRRVACRAYNTYLADAFRDYENRMTPVAAIPIVTPEEAVEELDHAVRVLGFKAVVFVGSVSRPIPRVQREHPEVADIFVRPELFALDSEYNYDLVWAKCAALKVACTIHIGLGAAGLVGHDSPSNYVYNHVGGLAAGHHGLCKALFMGGVTRRFPGLNFAFLEGGVGWACSVYSDIINHWEKRNGKRMMELEQSRVDISAFMDIVSRYADDAMRAKLGEIRETLGRRQAAPDAWDEFAACEIARAEDIRDLFVRPFFFGCEGDDPIAAQAFMSRVNPFNARLQAIFGSDIGHWDVPVMNAVLGEAHELVDRGAMTADDFRDFTFANAVRLHAGVNPDFFKGTRVEAEAARVMKARG